MTKLSTCMLESMQAAFHLPFFEYRHSYEYPFELPVDGTDHRSPLKLPGVAREAGESVASWHRRIYRTLSRAAFYELAKRLRMRHIEADEDELTAYCHRVVGEAVTRYRLAAALPDASQHRMVASIARYFSSHHNPALLRPEAIMPRGQRRKRDAAIVAAYEKAGAADAPSIRDLSQQFSVSKSSVQRILAAAGLGARDRRPVLSEAAGRLRRLCDELLPRDGHVYVSKVSLSYGLAVRGDVTPVIEAAAQEFRDQRIPLHFMVDEFEVTISRGREVDPAWVSAQRSGLRQRSYRQLSEPIGRFDTPEHRDLLSVLQMRAGCTDDRTIQRFVSITVEGHDHSEITRMVRFSANRATSIWEFPSALADCAFRRPEFALDLLKLQLWFGHDPHSEPMYTDLDLLGWWDDIWGYRARIASGDLPGRSLEQVDSIWSQIPVGTYAGPSILRDWEVQPI